MKIHHYGTNAPKLGELAEWSRARFGAAAGQVIWCQDSSDGASTRLMSKTFRDQDLRDRRQVMALEECGLADTFPAFADQLAEEGFAFLYQRMTDGRSNGRSSSRSTTGA